MMRLVVAAVVLVVTVLGLLGAAAWNGSVEAPAITLTERELQAWGNPAEETRELRLRLVYQHRRDPLDARTWLTEAKLAELGFAVAVPATAPEAERAYARTLPRLGFVALEFDGPAWQAIERQRALGRAGAPDDGSSPDASRLVPIDAGPDLETLRRRYQGQPVLVLPAVFGVRLNRPKEGAFLSGTLDRLVTEDVTGSIRLRGLLLGLPDRGRYEAPVTIGRLGVPRIVDIRPR